MRTMNQLELSFVDHDEGIQTATNILAKHTQMITDYDRMTWVFFESDGDVRGSMIDNERLPDLLEDIRNM
jgi:hypothetical protein